LHPPPTGRNSSGLLERLLFAASLPKAALHRSSSSPRSIQDRDTRASHAVAQISLSPDNSNRPPHKRRLGRRRLLPEHGLRVTGKAAPRRSSPPHPTPPCPAHPPPPTFRRALHVFPSAPPRPRLPPVLVFRRFRR